MEMDGDANDLHVPETLCRLFGVATLDDLYRRDWLRFANGDRVDDFLATFADCVKLQSSCDYELLLKRKDGEPLDLWKLMTAPVSPASHATIIYSGLFSPIDAVAKVFAEATHWAR